VGEAIRLPSDAARIGGTLPFPTPPVAPARGNEKGRVERAIRFVREAFFAARRFRDLEELNARRSPGTMP
jgi:hypothetical protein